MNFAPPPNELHAPLVWGGFIIRPDDEKFASFEGFPNECGIYGMYTRDGDLIYVGRSTAIHSRLRQHQRRTNFWGDSPVLFSYRLVPEEVVVPVEVAHIKALRPAENRFMEAGTHHELQDVLSAAIEHIWRDAAREQSARIEARYSDIAEQIAARL